jgi:type I restriction enzyme, S subunit
MSAVMEERKSSAEHLDPSCSVIDRSFDIAAAAPNGISALRELVLGVALRGRIDDPHRDLSAKTEQLGRQSLLPTFALPTGWRWLTVGELCTLKTGATPSTSKREYFDGNVKWLVSGDIHTQEIYDCEGRISELGMSNSNCKLLPPNSVLIALNGQGKTRATVAILRVPATCNQSLIAMTPRPESGITPEFLFWNLRFRYRQIRDITGQKQRRGLNMGLVSELPIAVAPVEEQHHIVARVDELMRLCDDLESKGRLEAEQHARLLSTLLGTLTDSRSPEELAANWQRVAVHFDLLLDRPGALDALEQTILQLAVRGALVGQNTGDEPAVNLLTRLRSERAAWLAQHATIDPECSSMLKKLRDLPNPDCPFDVPATWTFVRLLDCCRLLVDCHNKTAPYALTGIPIIRTSNIRNGAFRLEDLRYVTQETYEFWSRRCPPEPGDIMFTREAPMGEAAIIPSGAKYCLGQRTMLIRPMHDFIAKEYLLLTLTEPHLLERAAPAAIGSTVKHLRVRDVEQLTIPIPPLAEQRRIVARVDQLRHLCAELRQRLGASRDTQARLADALTACTTR